MSKWTTNEENILMNLVKKGRTTEEIAKELNRSYKSVMHRRADLMRGNPTFLMKDDETKREKEILSVEVKNSKALNYLGIEIGKNLYKNYKKINLIEPKLIYKNENKREEQSILDISDSHISMINEVFDSDVGRNVVTYNMKIFEHELSVLLKSVIQIHKLLSNAYNLKKLTIFIMGDIVTNDRIFEEQVFEIEKVVGLQVWDAINYLTYAINTLLSVYEKIDVVCVVGNHGRSLPDSYEEPVQNNYEYFIYKSLEKQFLNSKRVKIIVPESRRYLHTILHWRHFVEHGDSMRGTTATGIEKQIKDLSINVGGFDVLHYGHYHKLSDTEISDKVIVKQNGSWIYKDNYAWKKYKYYSIPKQWFFGCDEKRPETWHYKIDLRG